MNSFGTMALLKEFAAQPLDCHADATVCSGTSCLVRPSNPKVIGKMVIAPLLAVIMAFVMFSMGCTVELHKLLGHLRRPWGISIGFLCQFGIMPFTGFILALIFNVAPLYAVVIIIVGCCPGGAASNVLCYYMDGDMDLSISMTTCSTVMALGMMPLTLLIYTSLWVSSDTIQIPFTSIGIALVTLIIPVAIGISVNRKWPQKAETIIKIGSITGACLLPILAVVGGILYKSSFDLDPKIWIIAAIFPFIGYSLGFLLACFVGQPWYRCRTIALETSIQNVQLCNTIVQLSFSPAEVDVMFSFPIIYAIFQIAIVIVFVGGYQIYKFKCGGGTFEASSLEDGEAEIGKQKDLALENSGFEFSENNVEKSKDYNKDTQF